MGLGGIVDAPFKSFQPREVITVTSSKSRWVALAVKGRMESPDLRMNQVAL